MCQGLRILPQVEAYRSVFLPHGGRRSSDSRTREDGLFVRLVRWGRATPSKGGAQSSRRRMAHVRSRLRPPTILEGIAWKASLPAALGKPAIRNDRRDGEDVGII